MPSYIKDTTHTFNLLLGLKLASGDLLVTIDVNSLYTNIPHNEGISTINRSLEVGTDPLKKMYVCRPANLVLIKNYFTFNSKIYKKIGYSNGYQDGNSLYQYLYEIFITRSNSSIP